MDSKRLTELEGKWLDGTISPEEAEEYACWYNSEQDKPLHIPESIAKSKASHRKQMFGDIQKRIRSGNEENFLHKRKRVLLYAGTAAAVVFIIFSVGLRLYRNTGYDKKETPVFASRDISPGRQGLVLTLENGNKLLLDSLKDGIVAIQNGIKILKKNGTISYEGQGLETAYNTASTDRRRQYRIILPDGSRVWLNAASSITYPLAFSERERRVKITGEAYFEVAHRDSQPFIVEAGEQRIKVLGTHFNINAYADEQNVVTTLLQGRVAVTTGTEQTVIAPGQQAVTPHHGNAIRVANTDTANAVAWTNEKFMFADANITAVMRQIQRWYGVNVQYEKGVDTSAHFSGSTPMNQNLSELLRVLELSGVHFKVDDKTLTVLP